MSAFARRLDRVDMTIGTVWTSKARALAERIARDEGIPAHEFMASIDELIRAVGPPYTVERIAAYVEKTDGIPADELLAAVHRRMMEADQ